MLRDKICLKRSTILFLIFTCIIIDCSKDTNDILDPQDNLATITIISGNDQTGRGGDLLADPIVVQVTNPIGKAIKNVRVIFQIIEGNGVVNESTVVTDAKGLADVTWRIDASYNAMQVSIADMFFEAEPCFVYAEGENPTGISEARTINSLEKAGDNFYTITFYGDYSSTLESVNRRVGGGDLAESAPLSPNPDYFCTLFSAFGNSNAYLFGRSFDNPADWRCLTILGRYNPPDGYKSLALARMRDFGYEVGTNFDSLSFNGKKRLFEASFFPPDGVNEHGLVVGLASVRELIYTPDQSKKSIFITLLVREILDHASNVDEAAEIARQYNVFHPSPRRLACHALVADPSGRSIILEMYEGEIKIIPNNESWQVLTNTPIYNSSVSSLRALCWRYKTAYDMLKAANGNIDWKQGINILEQVAFKPGTEWSAIYDMTNRKIVLAIDYDFQNLYHFEFED